MTAIFSILKTLISLLLGLTGMLGFGADTTEVELYTNPASGYYWEYSVDEAGVLALSSSSYTPDTSALFSDGGGTQTFVFREIGAGTVNITFEYTQAGTGVVASRYVYTYEVSANGKITLVNIA